jgi:hypothetical protein
MSNFTSDDLARLDKAIAQGVMAVTFADGRKVEFSSFAELTARRNFVANELGYARGRQRLHMQFRKGVSP